MEHRLNLHIDEAGQQELSEGLHLVAIVFHDRKELETRIRRDLASFVFDHLAYFQQYDAISVYYDGGQRALSIALHDALDYVLASNVAEFRDADHSARRLLRLADYICTVERAAQMVAAYAG